MHSSTSDVCFGSGAGAQVIALRQGSRAILARWTTIISLGLSFSGTNACGACVLSERHCRRLPTFLYREQRFAGFFFQRLHQFYSHLVVELRVELHKQPEYRYTIRTLLRIPASRQTPALPCPVEVMVMVILHRLPQLSPCPEEYDPGQQRVVRFKRHNRDEYQ